MKKLNCQSKNYQCGGKCQSSSKRCFKNISVESATTLDELFEIIGRQTGEKKITKNNQKIIENKVAELISKVKENPEGNTKNIIDNMIKESDSIQKREEELSNVRFGDDLWDESVRESKTNHNVWGKPFDRFGKRLPDKKLAKKLERNGLSPKEARKQYNSLKYYSGEGAELMRPLQTGETIDWEVSKSPKSKARRAIKDINKFLSQSPKYTAGDLYRGLSFENEDDFNSFIEAANTGSIELDAISSFSSSAQQAKTFADLGANNKRVMIRVKGNTRGASVKAFSLSPSEQEVLVPGKSAYKSKVIQDNSSPYTIIELEEK